MVEVELEILYEVMRTHYTMTVSELIAELSGLDPDLPVVYRESGSQLPVGGGTTIHDYDESTGMESEQPIMFQLYGW